MATDRNQSVGPVRSGGKISIPELDNRLLMKKSTGQLYLREAVVKLEFSMVLVRHGETEGNKRMVLQGRVDSFPDHQLNARGQMQAQETAKTLFSEVEGYCGSRAALETRVKTGRFLVLTSPLRRARDTAGYFLKTFRQKTGMRVEAEMVKDLAEMFYGKLEGLTMQDIQDHRLKKLLSRYRSKQDASINWEHTGESFLDTIMRAKTLLELLNRRYQREKPLIAVFTHGTFSSALRAVCGDFSLCNHQKMLVFRDRVMDNGSLFWLSRL